jgi:hypothetical protein
VGHKIPPGFTGREGVAAMGAEAVRNARLIGAQRVVLVLPHGEGRTRGFALLATGVLILDRGEHALAVCDELR